jgi:hypothetical protein
MRRLGEVERTSARIAREINETLWVRVLPVHGGGGRIPRGRGLWKGAPHWTRWCSSWPGDGRRRDLVRIVSAETWNLRGDAKAGGGRPWIS